MLRGRRVLVQGRLVLASVLRGQLVLTLLLAGMVTGGIVAVLSHCVSLLEVDGWWWLQGKTCRGANKFVSRLYAVGRRR